MTGALRAGYTSARRDEKANRVTLGLFGLPKAKFIRLASLRNLKTSAIPSWLNSNRDTNFPIVEMVEYFYMWNIDSPGRSVLLRFDENRLAGFVLRRPFPSPRRRRPRGQLVNSPPPPSPTGT